MVTEIVKDLISLISRRSIIVMGHPALGGAAFLGEGNYHQGDDGIEGEVGDGHPVLQARPVTHDEGIEILDAAADGDDNPEDAKEGIEDAVLDDRTDADVLALAILLVDKL